MGQVEPRPARSRHRVLRARGPDRAPGGPRLPHRRLRLHDLHRELRPAARADLAGGLGRRARRLLGAVGQPELRGADPSGGEGELPRLSPARRRLRAGGADGHRSHDEPLGQDSDGEDVFLSTSGRAPRGDRRDVRSAVQGTCSGGPTPTSSRATTAGLARDPRGRPLRLARGLDLRPAPAVLRRHVARAWARSRHPGRPLPRSVGDSVTTDHISPAGAFKPDSRPGST